MTKSGMTAKEEKDHVQGMIKAAQEMMREARKYDNGRDFTGAKRVLEHYKDKLRRL